MTGDIYGFSGEYRWLSNFWPAKVVFQDIEFPSVEHGYVFSKGKVDLPLLLGMSAGQAKRYGRTVELNNTFEKNKLDIMYDLVHSKFSNNLELKNKLLATKDCNIVEFNTWGDTFWGVTSDGRGLNHLGNIIMRVRELLCVK